MSLLLLLLLAVGELIARVGLGLGDPPLSETHPSIEYLFAPNQDVRRFGNRVVINAYSMRSTDFPENKVANERRILVFGDSVLNGGNLTDQSDLATERLKERLIAQSSVPITVGNVSAGSWGPGNWLAYAREFGFFDADVVVLVLNSADIADNPTFQPLDPNTHPQSKPLSALLEGALRYLPRYLPKFGGGEGQPRSSTPTVEVQSREEAQRQAVERGSADLLQFLEMAMSQVPSVMLVFHPSLSELRDGHEPGRMLIAQIAAKTRLPVYSLDAALQQALDQGEMPYRDDIHINEIGQRVLSEQLLKALVDGGFAADH